jgi:hypothetical protein
MTLVKRLFKKAWVTPLPQGVNMTLVKRLFAKVRVTTLPQEVNMTPVRTTLFDQTKVLVKVLKPKYRRIETKVLHHQLEERWLGHP